MSQAQPDRGSSALRWLAVGLGAALLMAVLRAAVTSPEVLWLLLIGLGVGRAFGHATHALGAPAPLGQLAAGLLLGPHLLDLLSGALIGVPERMYLLGPDELAAAGPVHAAALAVIAGWVGRRLATGSLRGARRGVLGLFLGHLFATGLLTALAAIVVSRGLLPVDWLPAGIRIHDVGGLATALLGTSLVLTAAALHDADGEGPLSRTLLASAVLVELTAFAGLLTWAAMEGGGWSSLALAHPGSPAHAGESLLLGLFVGGLTLAIARQAPGGGLWSVVALLLTAALVAQSAHTLLLACLVAGAVLSLDHTPGTPDALDTTAGLAFSVVLTLAGAALPLHAVVGPAALIALGLVALRLLLVSGAAVIGARLLGAPPVVARYGWTGLVASTLPTAGLVTWGSINQSVHPELTAVLWAVAAIDGLLAPLAIAYAVRFADELPSVDLDEPVAASAPRTGRWVDPERFPPGKLRDHTIELEDDLRALLSELRTGAFEAQAAEQREYLDNLRRLYQRYHRQMVAAVAEGPSARAEAMRQARVQLADRWRGQVLDRAARLQRHGWQPGSLVHLLDRLAQQQPESLLTPMPEQAAGTAFDEATRELWGWLSGGRSLERTVPLRDLVRYHLSGQAPLRLEAVAAALIDGEMNLVARVRVLFQRTLDAYQELPTQTHPEALLDANRRELDADFRSALDEVEAGVVQLVHRVEVAFHQTLDELQDDLDTIGTAELPASDRNPQRSQGARERGVELLGPIYQRAVHDCRTRLSALSLEIELIGLELQVEVALTQHGAQLARLVRGRGTTQLQRVSDTLAAALLSVDGLLHTERSGKALAEALTEEASDFSHVAVDAARQADELREQLADEQILQPLHDALLKASHSLTERYEVPLGTGDRGSWRLPQPLASQEVPFREIVLGYIDTSVIRDMLALTQRYGLELHRAVGAIEELERAVTFSVELTAAELAEAGDEVPNRNDRDALGLALHDTVNQAHAALAEMQRESSLWFADIEAHIRASVLQGLETFRIQVADGRLAEIGAEVHDARGMRSGGRAARPVVTSQPSLTAWLLDRLGERQVARLRNQLGLLAEAPLDARLTPQHFAPPAPHARIPVVYRRLFSDRALHAGELLAGRRVQAERIRQALLDEHPGHLRSVALVGPPGAGHRAVVRAALRSLRSRGQHELSPNAPMGVDEVEAWFDRGRHGHVHVLTELHWLFSLQAGGFDPLRRLLDGIAADGGRNAWLAVFDEPTWAYASTVVPLARVFPVRVDLRPLNEAELRDAMLVRHGMSGFRLQFSGIDPDAPEIDQQRHRTSWFHAFHTATGGIAREALHTWVAAIDEVDVSRGFVRMGPVPMVATTTLRQLTDETVLLLRVAVRRGMIDDVTYSRLFRVDPTLARAHLAHLAHWGLLTGTHGRYAVPVHLHRALLITLRERGWA